MRRKYGVILIIAAVLALICCMPAAAHNVWLNPANHFPQVGETVDIGIGWGHSYPAGRVDQEMKDGRLEEILAVGPDGLPVELTKVSADLYQLKVEKAGAYLIAASVKSGFFTMTPKGRKFGDKKEVADAIKCTNYHIGAKTVLIAGGKAKNLEHVTGQTLELIPLTDPGNLNAGNAFSFKVLFEGKPVTGVSIKAKYAGFDEKNKKDRPAPPNGERPMPPNGERPAPDKEMAKPNKEGDRPDQERMKRKPYPCETETDAAGMATITPTQAGYWMVSFSNTSGYPDAAVCDECRYSMAFTLEVK